MLGLKRHTIEIVDHDPSWAGMGAEACESIRRACGELLVDVQHVGSTAVRGLPAKPILDIAAAAATFDSLPELVRRLEPIGYSYHGDRADAGGHLFVMDSPPDVRVVHLHVVEHCGNQWRNYLFFRDILRRNLAIRSQYAELKREIAEAHPQDRQRYTAAKADFIRRALNLPRRE